MISLFLSLACSDYELNHFSPSSEADAISSTKSGNNTLLSACESMQNYFPGLTETDPSEIFCPIDLGSDTYTADSHGRVANCSSVVNKRSETITDKTLSILFSESDPADLLNCNIPFTVFTEFSREEPTSIEDNAIFESASMWITLGDARHSGNLEFFDTDGLVDNNGAATDLFPVDALYLESFYSRFLDEYETGIVNRESPREGIFLTSALRANESVSEENSFGVDFVFDDIAVENTGCANTNSAELSFTDNADPEDGEKLAYSTLECTDYAMATLSTSINEQIVPLMETAAAFCGIDHEFNGTKRCVKYFGVE